MVTKGAIELITLIAEEKRQFLDQDWYGLCPAEEKRLKTFGLFEKAEIKDCIGFYILTNVEQKIIELEKGRLQRIIEHEKRRFKK